MFVFEFWIYISIFVYFEVSGQAVGTVSSLRWPSVIFGHWPHFEQSDRLFKPSDRAIETF